MEWVRTEIVVRFVECDPMGVAHHSNYLNWFEIGRFQYGQELGIERTSYSTDFYLPVINIQCSYKKPAYFGDRLFLETALEKPTKALLKFHYKLYRQPGRTLIAEGESEQVFTTIDGKLLFRIPAIMQKKIENMRWGDAKK